MKQNFSASIDVGSHTTCVVICDNKKTENDKHVVLGFGLSKSKGIKHGYITNSTDATGSILKAIHVAQKKAGVKIKSIRLAIGCLGITSAYSIGSTISTRADQVITKIDIEKAINEAESKLDLKNKKILHAYPVAFKIDGKELIGRPEGIEGSKLEVNVLFILSMSQQIDDLVDAIENAGISIASISATPILPSSILLNELQKNLGCVLIDIGAETVSVAVYENNVLTSTHIFGVGSLDITKDIALGLRIAPEDAENLKQGVVSFQQISKKKLDEIIEARLSDIFELVDKYLNKIGRRGLLPAGAIILGGGSQLPMTKNLAENILKIPVRIAQYDIPSNEGVLNDHRLLNAYSLASLDLEKTVLGNSNFSTNSGDSESIFSVIRKFFRDIIPLF